MIIRHSCTLWDTINITFKREHCELALHLRSLSLKDIVVHLVTNLKHFSDSSTCFIFKSNLFRKEKNSSIFCISADEMATEQYIDKMVNIVKSFYNSFWAILEKTRTSSEKVKIIGKFYERVRRSLEENVCGYHAQVTVSVAEVLKVKTA